MPSNFKKPNDADLSGVNQGQPLEGQPNIGRGADIHSQHANSARKNAKRLDDALRGEEDKQPEQKQQKSQIPQSFTAMKGDGKQDGFSSKLKEIDFQALEEFERSLEQDKGMQEHFKKDPAKVAKEEGIELPEGFQISFNEQYAKDKPAMAHTHVAGEMKNKQPKVEIRLGSLIIKE